MKMMKMMKKLKDFVSSKVAKAKETSLSAFQQLKIFQAALAAAIFGFSIQAQAALPQSVTEALDAAKADGMEAGWLVVGIIAALFVIAIVKRLLR